MKDGGVGRKEEWRPALETGDILVRREEEGDLPTFQSQDDRQVKQPLLYYRGESNRTNQSLDVKRLFVFFASLQVEIPIALRWGTRGSQF